MTPLPPLRPRRTLITLGATRSTTRITAWEYASSSALAAGRFAEALDRALARRLHRIRPAGLNIGQRPHDPDLILVHTDLRLARVPILGKPSRQPALDLVDPRHLDPPACFRYQKICNSACKPCQGPNSADFGTVARTALRRSLGSAETRVERVAKAVADQVQTEHGYEHRDAGGIDQVRGLPEVLRSVREHVAPRRCRRLNAEADERDRGFGEDELPDLDHP